MSTNAVSPIRFLSLNKMAILALSLSLLFPLSARSDDNLLANGDFSKGQESWGGDVNEDGSITDVSQSLSGPITSNHVVLHLHSSFPTRIYQAFRTHAGEEGNLMFSITCAVSAGSKFTDAGKISKVVTDFEVSPTLSGVSGQFIQVSTNPNYAVYTARFESPVVVLADRDDKKVYFYPLHITTDGNGNQTAGCSVNDVELHKEYKLYVAFPPGEGDVTITNISLGVSGNSTPTGASDKDDLFKH